MSTINRYVHGIVSLCIGLQCVILLYVSRKSGAAARFESVMAKYGEARVVGSECALLYIVGSSGK